MAATLNKRAKTLAEMAQAARFYYLDPWPYEEEAARTYLTPAAIPVLKAARERLAGGAELTEAGLTQLLKDLAGELGVKVVEVAQPLRVALTGRAASPSLTELIPILGRAECVRRLDHALRQLGA